jgi:hypothetical protein
MEEKIYSDETLGQIAEMRNRFRYAVEESKFETKREIEKRIGRGWSETPQFFQAIKNGASKKMELYFSQLIFPRETEPSDFQFNPVTLSIQIVNPNLAKQFLLFGGCL